MKTAATNIKDVFVVEGAPFSDHRGKFMRLFCADELTGMLSGQQIVQVNYSLTKQAGSVRGLHYQKPPFAEIKFVRCLRGRVLDVAVDIRSDSPTFLQWHAEELSADNARMLVVPQGCAHGFQTLEDDTELLYLHTGFYSPEHEGGLAYNDPAIGIDWPLPAGDVSERDKNHPVINGNFKGISL